MGLPAERIDVEPQTEQVIEFDDGPCFSEDGMTADVEEQTQRERMNRVLEQ